MLVEHAPVLDARQRVLLRELGHRARVEEPRARERSSVRATTPQAAATTISNRHDRTIVGTRQPEDRRRRRATRQIVRVTVAAAVRNRRPNTRNGPTISSGSSISVSS